MVTILRNGRRIGRVTGRSVRSVRLTGLHGRYSVKLVVRYADGRTRSSTVSLLGC